ncbi:MAG: DUF4834 family protein [Bacteroidales bacterium]|nr:DUF4834 family protein [Bacteroidales bacterium]
MKVFLVLILIYLIIRLFRNLTVMSFSSRTVQNDDIQQPPPPPKPTKIIEKDEGEYVDFEEMKEK